MDSERRESACSFRWGAGTSLVVVALLLCAVGVVLLPITSLAQDVAPAQMPKDSAVYMLVLDNSGSMLTDVGGSQRWEIARDNAIALVKQVPLETRFWIAVFSTRAADVRPITRTISTEKDRQELLDALEKSYPKPDPSAGTAYYDTLALAFDEVERLSKDNPTRPICVAAYTDGEDRDSTTWTLEKLAERYKDIRKLNTHVWVWPPLDEGKGAGGTRGTPPVFCFVDLSPSLVPLENAKRNPEQEVDLVFQYTEPRLDGKPIQVTFTPAPGQPLAARVEGGPFALTRGHVPVRLVVTNPDALAPDKEYSGALHIEYPDLTQYADLRDYVVVPQNAGKEVRVTFAKDPLPQLTVLSPVTRDGQPGGWYPTRKPVLFKAVASAGAEVLWNMGDGTTLKGPEQQYTYNKAQQYTVKVTATADPAVGSTKLEFPVNIVDIGVALDPLNGKPFAAVPFTFTCTGRGPIQGYTWVIDGRQYEGEGSKGNRITYTFQTPGTHLVGVAAYAEKLTAQSHEVAVAVESPPRVSIMKPVEGQAGTLGEPLDLEAKAEGPVDAVKWSITRQSDGLAGPDVEPAAVKPDAGGVRTASAQCTPQEALAAGSAPDQVTTFQVRAQGVLSAGARGLVTAPSDVTTVRLKRPARSIAIVGPAENEWRFGSGQQVTPEFRAQLVGPGATKVKWSMVREADGKVIAQGESNASPSQAQQTVSWAPALGEALLPSSASSANVVVHATVVLADGLGARAPAAQKRGLIGYRGQEPHIATDKPTYDFLAQRLEPVVLRIDWPQPASSVEWNFGDGSTEAGGTEVKHTYQSYGDFGVSAVVRGRDGKEHPARLSLTVTAADPVAVPSIRYRGKVLGSEVHRVPRGSTLQLAQESKGDVVKVAWVSDGKELAPDAKTVTLETKGRKSIRLTVSGPPQKDSGVRKTSTATVEFDVVQYRWWLFIGMGACLVLLLAGTLYLLGGNQPRGWRIRGAVNHVDDTGGFMYLKRFWSWTRKAAVVPMKDIFPGMVHRDAGEESDDKVLVLRDHPTGKDDAGGRPSSPDPGTRSNGRKSWRSADPYGASTDLSTRVSRMSGESETDLSGARAAVWNESEPDVIDLRAAKGDESEPETYYIVLEMNLDSPFVGARVIATLIAVALFGLVWKLSF